VTYQLVHALAMFGVALLATHLPGRLVTGPAFVRVGILLFSGSLYVLTLTGISKLGIITPFGGLASWPAGCAWAWPPGACSDRLTLGADLWVMIGLECQPQK
jgi:uncharacterized membrane protein YgdD (TMEM256/DUF423 family)